MDLPKTLPDATTADTDTGTGTGISFIIPHKGRVDLLNLTVQSIIKQAKSNPHLNIDIVIVTQNQSLSLGVSSKDVDLQIIERPESDSISMLRNTGADNSKGYYLAFTDADIDLSSNWLECLIEIIQTDPNTMLASACQSCSETSNSLEKIRTALSNLAVDTDVEFLPGSNLLLKKDTFIKAGKFPPQLRTCEDYFFTNKVNEIGRLVYTSKTSFIHLGEDKNYTELFKKETWRGQSNLQSIQGRSISLAEIPSFIVPLWVFVFTIFSVISLASIWPTAALLASALAFGPIAVYTIRLYLLTKKRIGILNIGVFYCVYFPARGYGTLLGLIKSITR